MLYFNILILKKNIVYLRFRFNWLFCIYLADLPLNNSFAGSKRRWSLKIYELVTGSTWKPSHCTEQAKGWANEKKDETRGWIQETHYYQ